MLAQQLHLTIYTKLPILTSRKMLKTRYYFVFMASFLVDFNGLINSPVGDELSKEREETGDYKLLVS